MIKILYLLAILCTSLAINIIPHKSPIPTVSVKPHPVQSRNKTVKNISTSTATVGVTIKNMNITPVFYTAEQKNKTNVLQNKTNILQNKTSIGSPTNSIPEKKRTSTILKLIFIGFILFIGIGVYFKLKKMYKPKPKEYLPYNVIDRKPIIEISRNNFNAYNREDEKCYKRLSGSNSPV